MTTARAAVPAMVGTRAVRAHTPREQLATRVLVTAALLAIAADLLLRGGNLGMNGLLLSCLFTAAVATLDATRGEGALHAPGSLYAILLVAGALPAWRAAEPLVVGAVAVAMVTCALIADALRTGPGWSPWRLDPWTPIVAWALSARGALVGGGPLLLHDVPRDVAAGSPAGRALGAGWRGALLALPMLVAFGALLTSADPVFAGLLQRIVRVDIESVVGHAITIGVLTWLAAGWLRSALLAVPEEERAATVPRALGAGDVLVPLALLDTLFAAFVLVQLRTLVGGAAYVRAATGLGIADWARRGFFELLWVAALALPLLVAAHALAPAGARTRRRLRALTWVALALLGAILASAAYRMHAYLQAFGLTELRLYASLAMLWLGGVIAWFGATVARGRRERFVGGALAGALGLWLATAAMDPDAVIVQANLRRLDAGRPFDVAYVASLGADATPSLVAALPRLTTHDACIVRTSIAHLRAQRHAEGRDWRGASLAGLRADRAARAAGIAGPTLEREACPSPVRPAPRVRPG